MHSSFNIDPVSFTGTNLVVELSEDTCTFCWINSDTKKAEGLHSWKYDKVRELADIIEKLPHKPSNVSISFNTREYILYPGEMTGTSPEEMIGDVFGKLPGVIYERRIEEGSGGKIAFRVPFPIEEIVTRYFPGAEISHSLVCNYAAKDDSTISLVFYERQFTMRVYNHGLKLLNLYRYTSPGEVAYILLHACSVYNIDPAVCTLRMSGLIDENSKLYNELYRYFMNLSFSGGTGENFSSGFENYPVHYFDHFHFLDTCGS